MKSVFSRLFITISLILTLTMVLIGITFQWFSSQYMKKEAIASLQNDANVIASLYQASYGDASISPHDFHMALTVAISVSGADAVICDANGTLLYCADSPMGCEHTGLQLDRAYRDSILETGGFTDTGIIGGLYEEERYLVSVAIRDTKTGAPFGIVLLSSPVQNTLSMMWRIWEIFLVVAAIMIVLSVLVATFLVRRQSNPLRDMARAAHSFEHGKFDARVTTSGHNSQEVEELALAFNNMASSLQKSEYQRQEFVANVSHELKTPMTTISGYVDGILDGTIPPEKHQQYLQTVSDETKRLSRLVRNMLDISRLQDDPAVPEERKIRFDLCEITGQVLIAFEQKINDKELEVEVEMPDYPVYTLADQDAINQVIYNLVDNGVKFCPQKGTMGIRIHTGSTKIYLSVFNSGEDIPAKELPLVFERFHKIDKSRSVNRDSWGLGLYIVKTIINAHGENISVSSEGGRTEFTFTLPLVQ